MRTQTEEKSKSKVDSNRGTFATLKLQSEKVVEQVENIFAGCPRDSEAAIKMDHESLRNYLKTLKDVHEDMKIRRRAYDQFAGLLKSHSFAEENIVYVMAAKRSGRDMHIQIAEGYVEHHLDEEERDLLPLIREATTAKLDADMLGQYLLLRGGTQKKVNSKNSGVLKIKK